MSRCVSINIGLFGIGVRFKIDNDDGSEPREYSVSEDDLIEMLEGLAGRRQKDRDAEVFKLRVEADVMYAQGDKRGAQKLHDEAADLAQRERLD